MSKKFLRCAALAGAGVAVGVAVPASWGAAPPAAVALAGAGRRREPSRALAAASATWLAGQGLKKLFLRPRPYEADPEGTRLMIGKPKATSWPGSHPAGLVTLPS